MPPQIGNTTAIDSSAAAPAGAALSRTFRALRHRNYRLFFAGQSISQTGTWMQTIAQAWLVLELTNSKAALGTVTMLQFLPITIFVLVAGVVVDRVPKHRFLIVTQSLAAAQAAALALLVWTGQVRLWHVYGLAFVLGLANAFDQPTRQSFVVEMVGKDDLPNAIALNSGMFNAARLLGPAVGGFVIATIGVRGAFLANAVSFLPVIAALLLIDPSQLRSPPRAASSSRAHPLREVTEGLRYALATPSALLVVLMLAFIGTFGYNFSVVLPLVDRYVLHRGSVGLGLMTASVGAGALLAAAALAAQRRASLRTMLAGAGAFGLALAGVGVSRWFPVTVALLVLVGAAGTFFTATANTTLQLSAPDELRGRVMSLYMLLFAGSTPVGGYLTGRLAQHLGVPETVILEGSLCLAGFALGVAYYTSHRAHFGITASEAPAPRSP
ncbi:MAG TPA: MFS transporter [Dehalococcoidia bacterium]|nr:MFS transporter [Dehalococcoidia bacterium]